MKHRFRRVHLMTAHRRATSTDRTLATFLTAIAGSANAGGFILLGQYTSHMTGYMSQLADNLVLHNINLVLQSIVAILCFVFGAASSAVMINWARDHHRRRQYTIPIAVQGVLFVGLAALGWLGTGTPWANAAALGLLCFIMGLQNATITKISGARIRTTHVTGMVTDTGIALGRAMYWRASRKAPVPANTAALWMLIQLLVTFVVGGILGAIGYGTFGFSFSLLLAVLLLSIAFAPRR
jgi:uncharacterized membrane protein YoaK (UPF0700 family)